MSHTAAPVAAVSPSRSPAEPVLALRGIGKSFGGVAAVADVDLEARAGEVLAIVGENGAGKSTLMKVIAGVFAPGSFDGEVVVDGVPRRFRTIREAEAAGVVLVPQELHIAPGLSIAENMFMGRLPGRGGFVDEAELRRQTVERLRFFGITARPDAPAAVLSPSEQRLVTIAAALTKSARLIILDEPTAALTEAEAAHLFDHIRSVRAAGVACLYISHRLDEVERIADRIVVMRNGRVVSRMDDAKDRQADIVRAMIGRDPERAEPRPLAKAAAAVLSIEALRVFDPRNAEKRLVDDVGFTLGRGEILGLFGLIGAGRTELARAVFGAWPGRVEGVMTIDGVAGFPRSPRDAIARGIGMLTEDRKQTGLVPGQSALVNMSAASLDRVSGRVFIDSSLEYGRNRTFMRDLDVRPARLGLPIQSFSGGNQQKVLLARWLATEPKILILDEPTLGVDVGARFELYRIIRGMADRGLSVLLISSDLNEVLDECDRILVMYKGRLSGTFGPTASRHAVMAAATGRRN